MKHDHARAVADAVLFEGYALYPYRRSSLKNRGRWAFGVLAPRAFAEADGGEAWWMSAELLVEVEPGATLEGELRFLRPRRRRVDARDGDDTWRAVSSMTVDGKRHVEWDEGEIDATPFATTLEDGASRSIAIVRRADADEEIVRERSGPIAGRVRRERADLACVLHLSVARVDAVRPLARVTLRVENVTPCAPLARDAVRASFTEGTHLALSVDRGAFVSLLDPPAWAEREARACANVRAFPVLVGDEGARASMLASPIILYDYPRIAPESPGDFFDATEIDELLTLRTRTLTDDEKAEARALDPRVAAIVDRVDAMDDETFARLHGAARDVDAPSVVPGARVVLRPGKRRADAQDMFLDGMTATVRAVLRDVNDRVYFAVTVDDDPATDLHLAKNRFLYFGPDEVQPP